MFDGGAGPKADPAHSGAKRRARRGALIDRLLHHCHIVNIRGNSYGMRATRI